MIGYKTIFSFVAAVFTLIMSVTCLNAAEIEKPIIALKGNNVNIDIRLTLDEAQIGMISDGIQMELIFYINLFKKWDIWPDEFIKGEEITRIIKADTVKGEFTATSQRGLTIIEKRFKSFDSMLVWALNIKGLTFTIDNNDSMDSDSYFVRVTVESHKRKLPKIFGYVLFFINDKEFKIKKESSYFNVR